MFAQIFLFELAMQIPPLRCGMTKNKLAEERFLGAQVFDGVAEFGGFFVLRLRSE
jgi:hypothetical protein